MIFPIKLTRFCFRERRRIVMAKHTIKITTRFTIPMYFKDELVMASTIGNSLVHRYIVYPETNEVKFIRWSVPDNDFIEVKDGGPAPKLGDNIVYKADGAVTKWRYVKPPQSIIGKALWNEGLSNFVDETYWYWAEEGDGRLEEKKMNMWDRSMNFASHVERMTQDECHKLYSTISWKGKVCMAWGQATYRGLNKVKYIIGFPRFFVANAAYKDEIEANINECLRYLLDKYVQIGKIRETRFSGMYLPPITK